MRLFELLLSKSSNGSSSQSDMVKEIEDRMDYYVDKLLNPSLSPKGKDLLMKELKKDYSLLKRLLPEVYDIREAHPNQQLSLYKPDGTSYRKQPMPTLGPDPVDNADSIDTLRNTPDDHDFTADVHLKRTMAKYISKLSEKDQEILKFRYWDGLELEELAEFYGIRRERARQLEARALGRIRRLMYNDEHREDIMKSDETPKDNIAEEDPQPAKSNQYEVYDKKTGERVKGGPYSTAARARRAVDKLDNAYGAYRYGSRPIGNKPVTEAVHKVPITREDFGGIKEMMNRPIPAVVARVYIQDSIDDDEFNAELEILEDTDPGRDVRPLIAEWFKRVMPDQLFHFTGEDEKPGLNQQRGILSPIHGYDPKMYKGSNDPITGNAYGFR